MPTRRSKSRQMMLESADTTILHGGFSIERHYDATLDQVFAAWAEPGLKKRWFSEGFDHSLDFRVGGLETCEGLQPGGRKFTNTTYYHDIVPGRRLIFSYRLAFDDETVSVSQVTVLLDAHAGGTRIVFAEQGTFLGKIHTPDRRKSGWVWLLNRLGEELDRTVPND